MINETFLNKQQNAVDYNDMNTFIVFVICRYVNESEIKISLVTIWYPIFVHYIFTLDIGNKVQQSEWYKGLSADDQRRLPMKLYEFIPRTCSIDIPGTDDSIQLETEITIDTNKDIKIPIYSIKDGKTVKKYKFRYKTF